MTTLAEILSRYPVGSDERLNALAEWRRLEDERLGAIPRPVKPPPNKRAGRPPLVPAVAATIVHPNSQLARSAWETRRDETQAAKEAAEAVAIKARLKKAVELETVRINALANMSVKSEKLRRLNEIQASLMTQSPKTLAVISKSLGQIEARLSRLSAE
jgi:hypothetical protein